MKHIGGEKMERQGDLLIMKVDKLPKGKLTQNKVLAEGEVTGHKHQLRGQVQVYEFENQKYLEVQEAELVHEEHQKLELDQGLYKVVNQREYSYLNNELRRVAD
jgi:hypothetical protein